MTFAEFQAVTEGFRQFNSGKEEAEAPSDDDFYRDLAQAMANGRA